MPGSNGTSAKLSIIPIVGPIPLVPRLDFGFDAESIMIVNNTQRQLFLGKVAYPTGVTDALVTIEPRMVYPIQQWQWRYLYIGLAAALVAGEYITLQASDQFNPAPASLMITSPIPTVVAGDAAANPTTGQEISYPNVYDQATGLWWRWRGADQTGGTLGKGVGAVAPHLFDSTAQVEIGERTARSLPDGIDGSTFPGAGAMIYNAVAGLWTRLREAAADGLAVTTGVVAVAPYVLGATLNRLKEASADALASTGVPAVGAMLWNGATLDRTREATGDGLAATGIQATGNMVVDPTSGTWDRFVTVAGDGVGPRSRPAVLPLVWNGAGWDRLREATGDGLAATGVPAGGTMVFDPTSSTWDRLASVASDGVGNRNRPGVLALVWNGANWDRWKGSIAADNQAATGLGGVSPMVFDNGSGNWDRLINPSGDGIGIRGGPKVSGMLFNASTWDRPRDASAANVAAASGQGVAEVVEPGHWTLHGNDTVNPVSLTRAAVAGTRHVLRTILAVFGAGSGIAASRFVHLYVRDGASGAGGILWEAFVSVPNAAGSCTIVELSGLSVVGSVNTAMTVEFSASFADTYESISATGYDAA